MMYSMERKIVRPRTYYSSESEIVLTFAPLAYSCIQSYRFPLKSQAN